MVKWGLIGASNIARDWLVDAINRHPESDVKSVLSSSKERAQDFARAKGIKIATTDIEEILGDPEIDAVYVSTTNDRHHDEVIAAARAGKHILCEKPLALSVNHAESMVEACTKAGVVLATNHHIRNHESHRTIKTLIDNGDIGSINSIRMFFAVMLPDNLKTWRIYNKAAGAGAILDLTVHCADTLRFYTGRDPKRVIAFSATVGDGPKDVEDGVMSVWEFPDNIIAQCHDSLVVPHAGTGVEVHGTKASIFAPDTLWQKASGKVVLRNAGGEKEIPFEKKVPYDRTIADFVLAMRGQGNPSASGRDGLWSLKLGLAVQQSAAKGRAVEIN